MRGMQASVALHGLDDAAGPRPRHKPDVAKNSQPRTTRTHSPGGQTGAAAALLRGPVFAG